MLPLHLLRKWKIIQTFIQEVSFQKKWAGCCHQKWFKEIKLTPDQTVNWKAAYQLSFQCTKSSKLIVFDFKFLHWRISTNSFLQKLGLVDSWKWTFCQDETEKLLHLFWECEKTQSFWNSLFTWLQSCQMKTNDKPSHVATTLGLRLDKSKYKLQINFSFPVAKYYIWVCKLKGLIPKLDDFLGYLKYIYQIEKNNASTKKKWEPNLPYL